MLGALAATLLFAVSAVSARRSLEHIGSPAANLVRQLIAVLLLGAYAHTLGTGWAGPARGWFLLSGFIGYGLGDLALFLALPRIGSRLTALMTQCLAAPLAAGIEWLWLGRAPSAAEVLSGMVILGGVALALAPSRPAHAPAPTALPRAGIAWGVIAAAGQAGGAVVSRYGYDVLAAAGSSSDALTVTYQRIVAGVVVALAWHLLGRGRVPILPGREQLRRAAPWFTLNALAGPTLGVACYQWALQHHPTAVVLPVVATTPLAVIPLAWFLEHERPSRRSLIGGCLAVAGVALLARFH